MPTETAVTIPARFQFLKTLGKNRIFQLRVPETKVRVEHIEKALTDGTLLDVREARVPVRKMKASSTTDDSLLWSSGRASWARPIEAQPKWNDLLERRKSAMLTLRDKFRFLEEERNPDKSVKTPGLRPPQIGSIHAALGHWRMSSDFATIVMPTGTGKTDSMVGLLAVIRPSCLLAVVPTDILREQLAKKFARLGVLREFGILPSSVDFPLVGVIKSKFQSVKEMKVFFEACNVAVTTMPLLSTFDDVWQTELASFCSHLFIDEAHHVKAVTWSRLRAHFGSKPTLQFTATPYRNDGQHVDGRIIFNYPLALAQQEGYFNKIVLKELWEPVDGDEAVAKAAVEQLKNDLAKGLDHLVMARTARIDKAEDLKKIYEKLAPEYSPTVVHSRLKRKELVSRMAGLDNRDSRIAVCVSMFGEGFDLPELKIAALHDIHQSLAVSIQFAGRFTRSNSKVGDATIIVNRAETEVNNSVRELYAQGEGADWNRVLTRLTAGATKAQIEKEDFYRSFGGVAPPVPIQNVTPKMSTVVYQTLKKWDPWRIEALPHAKALQGELSVSLKENLAFFVTLTRNAVEWADADELIDQWYDLFALHWDPDTKLLYINSSDNSSLHEGIAKAVGGDDVALINGTQAFRVLDGINRLTLRNMGLNDRLKRSVKFMMFSGADIKEYLEDSDTHGKEKTHVFGDGFNGIERVTIGTSKKGRIWSWKEADDLLDWKMWCHGIGKKLLDSTITPDSFLQDSMIPEDILGTPELYPLFVEWPDELFRKPEHSILVQTAKDSIPFFNVDIDLVEPGPKKPIKFAVRSHKFKTLFRMNFNNGHVSYAREEGEELFLKTGKKTVRLSDFFGEAHPIVRYEKDCFSRGDQLMRPRKERSYPFDPEKIFAWQWDGVDATKESQTEQKLKDSIQYRVLEKVASSTWDTNYEILFDDDAPGEAADVVGIARGNGVLKIDFFHCKYSKDVGGKRIKDLYEVCGQAQRCRKWRDDIDRLFAHLTNREKARLQGGSKVSRFERGTFKLLEAVRFDARALIPHIRVFIVQPGLSKAAITPDQKELLGTTKIYLHETVGIKFVAIGAA